MTGIRSLAKASALRMVGFVVARPALDAFLRRLVYRFPGLAGRIRAAVARSRRAPQNLAPELTEDDLTDKAREVLQDLLRAQARHQRH